MAASFTGAFALQAGSHRLDPIQGLLRGLVFVVFQLIADLGLEHGSVVTGCQTFDFFDRDHAIGGGFTGFDAE